jgi:uncharacterized protein (TIGR00369 family)
MTKYRINSKADIAKQFMRAIPFSTELSMSLDLIENGFATISMPYDERFVGDLSTGILHGGAVSSLLDTCGGAAVMCHPAVPEITATLDFRIDYMRPATPNHRITAKAECYHVTRSVAFVRATAYDEDENRPVATATGTFIVQNISDNK